MARSSIYPMEGFSRNIGELEWLLLVLVILYTMTASDSASLPILLVAMIVYTATLLILRLVVAPRIQQHWALALENWLMLIFLTVAIRGSGLIESPLINGYLLVIIASALTLGQRTTRLQIALIFMLFLYMAHIHHGEALFTPDVATRLLVQIMPLLLVAYFTSILSSSIEFQMRNLKIESETDVESGLPNRRHFQQLLAIERRLPCSVIQVEADNWNEIVEGWGREEALQSLTAVVDLIRLELRSGDQIARESGGNLLILLPGAGSDQAATIGHAIRARIEAATLEVDREEAPTTVTIGIASSPQHAATPSALIEQSDQALELARLTGRNSVMVAATSV